MHRQSGRSTRRLSSRVRAFSCAGTAAVLLLSVAAGPAQASSRHAPASATHHKAETPEHALVHWINQARAKAGLHPVTVAGDLTSLAHRHAAHMAKIDRVYHDPLLGSEVHGWRSLAEDVGSASRLVDLEQAFMSSPSDRVNLRTPGFRQLGVGVSVRDGLLYVTVIMRQPVSSSQG
jgi:uncharacterized protein YkwD